LLILSTWDAWYWFLQQGGWGPLRPPIPFNSKAERKGRREGGREIDRWNLLVIGFPCSWGFSYKMDIQASGCGEGEREREREKGIERELEK
jgi:hypothetical protein